jgi:hypothetical protein
VICGAIKGKLWCLCNCSQTGNVKRLKIKRCVRLPVVCVCVCAKEGERVRRSVWTLLIGGRLCSNNTLTGMCSERNNWLAAATHEGMKAPVVLMMEL